jgi:hypothetical protein
MVLYSVIPTIRYSTKGETIKTIKKINGCHELEGRRDEQVDHRGFLG